MFNEHFQSGGSQRRHQCLSSFSTRCIRELIDHIIFRQTLDCFNEVVILEVNLVGRELHYITCICAYSLFIANLMGI